MIGTNEEYRIDVGDEGPFNAGPANAGRSRPSSR